MNRRTIVVPLFDNEGASLANEHDAIASDILDIAGGYSAHEQSGVWRGPDGTLYHDRSLVYEVLCDEQTDTRIHERTRVWCGWTKQECLLTTTQTVQASFIEPTESLQGMNA